MLTRPITKFTKWLAFGVAAISGGGSRVAGIAIAAGHALQYLG